MTVIIEDEEILESGSESRDAGVYDPACETTPAEIAPFGAPVDASDPDEWDDDEDDLDDDNDDDDDDDDEDDDDDDDFSPDADDHYHRDKESTDEMFA